MPLETLNFADRSNVNAEKFTPTPEELRTIEEKMRDPEFLHLFQDYMKSMEDPETRREEEAYLQQVEREAKEGGDRNFDFVFPRPGFTVELLEPSTTYNVTHPSLSAKTVVRNKNIRVYVNMCSSEKIDPFREDQTGDSRNSNWYVPVSISRPRTELFSENYSASVKRKGDIEPKEEAVMVYDAVFHPNTLQLADRSDRFCCFLVNIAVEHINTGYGDRHGFQFRRLSSNIHSVGTPQNQTITRSGGKSPFAPVANEPVLKRPTQILPSSDVNNKAEADSCSKNNTKGAENVGEKKSLTGKRNVIVANPSVDEGNLPRYTITHRGRIDLSDTWGWKIVERRIGVPEELIVKMEFDGLRSVTDLGVEVEDAYVTIARSTAHTYHGVLTLPFSVEPTPLEAKFERRRSLLTLVLRVIPPAPAGMTAADMRQQHAGQIASVAEDDEGATSSTFKVEDDRSDVPCDDGKMKGGEKIHTGNVAPMEGFLPVEEEREEKNTLSAPQLSFIEDQDRVRLMMERVQAARRDREKIEEAARNNCQQQENKPNAEMVIERGVQDRKKDENSGETSGMLNGVTESRTPHDDEKMKIPVTGNTEAMAGEVADVPSPSVMDGVIDSSNAEVELELLKQRQDLWRMDIQQRIDSKDEEDRKEALATEREARRDAERMRKRVDAAKLQEEAEARFRERMLELPLQNKHIFTID